MLQDDSVSAPRDFQQLRQAKHKVRHSRAPQMTPGRPNIADDVLEVISIAQQKQNALCRHMPVCRCLLCVYRSHLDN